MEAGAAAARDPATHRYTPAAGLPELRQAIAASSLDDGLAVDADRVVVTNGAKQAVFTAFQVLLDPGDEVLVPAPYWVTYPASVELAAGLPVVIDTHDAADFQVTVDQLEEARTDRTKVLLFASPSNPTGAVYDRDRMQEIGRWAAGHGISVVTDDDRVASRMAHRAAGCCRGGKPRAESRLVQCRQRVAAGGAGRTHRP